MANIHVWDSGDNSDGTTWAKAYTDIQTAWTNWTSGDEIWVASDHSQTQASDEQFISNAGGDTDPTIWYSIDRSDDSYLAATSPQIAVTGTGSKIQFSDSIHAYGIYFQTEDGNFTLNPANSTVEFVDCHFKATGTTTNRFISLNAGVFEKCTFENTSGSGQLIMSSSAGGAFIKDCTFSGRMGNTYYFTGSWGATTRGVMPHVLMGCDFSGITTTSYVNNTDTAAAFINCKIASGDSFRDTTGTYGAVTRNYASSVDGASTAKNYIAEHYFCGGNVTQDTAVYRDDGWQSEEGDTRLSHKLTTTSALSGPHTPIFGPDLRAYVSDTGSTTFTVYGVHDSYTAAPTLDEAGLEVSYLGTSNSLMHTLGQWRTVKSSTGLTSDTKSWTGASGKTKFKLTRTVTINKAGIYVVRVYWGKYEASKAAWYCPLVEVS